MLQRNCLCGIFGVVCDYTIRNSVYIVVYIQVNHHAWGSYMYNALYFIQDYTLSQYTLYGLKQQCTMYSAIFILVVPEQGVGVYSCKQVGKSVS